MVQVLDPTVCFYQIEEHGRRTDSVLEQRSAGFLLEEAILMDA